MPSKVSQWVWRPRRERLLARKAAGFRGIEEGDIAWLWAAAKKGGFKEIEPFQTDDQEEFYDGVTEVLERFPLVLVLTAFDKPSGLLLSPIIGLEIEPHVEWFPWTTARQRLEGWVNFLLQYRKGGHGLIKALEVDKKFYDHVCRYGVLRAMGYRDHNVNPKKLFFYEIRTR